jgi:putative ABC transport system ATP-binding protein
MIKTESLTKTYRTGTIAVQALQDLSIHIGQGEFVAIMGASGSGKSTLMNLLGLLDHPSTGRYILDGLEVSALNEQEYAHIRNQKIGFVFHLSPPARLTALKNVNCLCFTAE